MHCFEHKGKKYCFSLNLARVDRIKARHEIDLLDAEITEIFSRLVSELRVRFEMYWDILDDKESVELLRDPDTGELMSTENSFKEILNGDTLEAADEAFWKELSFFFQSINPAIKEQISQMRKNMTKASQRAIEAINKMAESPEMERAWERTIAKSEQEARKQIESLSGK